MGKNSARAVRCVASIGGALRAPEDNHIGFKFLETESGASLLESLTKDIRTEYWNEIYDSYRFWWWTAE